MINISGLNKAEVLKALWEHSSTDGLTFLGAVTDLKNGTFTIKQARDIVESTQNLKFGYVCGHMINCDLSGDMLNETDYDGFCGEGTAQKAITRLRKEVDMLEHAYEGLQISIEVKNSLNNDKIAEAFHNALRGKQDYIDSNVILNKDPDVTTGKEQTGVYICKNDVKEYTSIIDSVTNALKSIEDLI